MKLSKSRWMGRDYTIDRLSLVVGDKVEVCMCDTSATCVHSYPAIVAQDTEGLYFDHRNPEGNARHDRPKDIDGCYTYLARLDAKREADWLKRIEENPRK